MVRAGEIEHGLLIASRAETVWNWSTPAGEVRARRRAELIMTACRLGATDHALELGCGTGLFSRMFARTGCRLTAVDVSEPLLEHARRQLTARQVSFQQHDAEALPHAAGSFDVVLGSSVLHHLDLSLALGEAFRVLRPGGRFAFAEPNYLNPQIAAERLIPPVRRWVGASPEETAFVRWPLTRRLERMGFTDVAITPFDFLHPAVPAGAVRFVSRFGKAIERWPVLREIAGSLLIQATKPADGLAGRGRRP